MSNIDQEREAFAREDRYIVIKRKDLAPPLNYGLTAERVSALMTALGNLHDELPNREYLVIESDWPEYEKAWSMIEARMTGAQAPRDEFPELYACLDALDERAAEQPERIAVRRHLVELIDPALERLRKHVQYTAHLPAVTLPVIQRDNVTIKQETIRFVFRNGQGGSPWAAMSDFNVSWYAKLGTGRAQQGEQPS